MADYIEHQDKGELVANCDQLQNDEVVVTTPVESRIMSIRGKQIMIDRDLAELYGVETRGLNQAVKRNMERFPERFRFQLTKEEMNELVTNCDRFKCRSFPTSFNNGVPSTGNAATSARNRQTHRRGVSQIGRGQRKAEAGCVLQWASL